MNQGNAPLVSIAERIGGLIEASGLDAPEFARRAELDEANRAGHRVRRAGVLTSDRVTFHITAVPADQMPHWAEGSQQASPL